MPRPKNKPTTTAAEPSGRSRARSQLLATGWTRALRAGKEVKKDYDRAASEVRSYLKSDHSKLYKQASENFHDFTSGALMSVPKLAQMRGALGPRLAVAEPRRTVIPRSKDPVMIGMSRLIGAYLTYTASEVDFAKTMRRAIGDGLEAGRMVLRQTWDEVKGIVTPVFLRSEDLLFDPDFTSIEDGSWIAIRHREPLWQLKRRIPEKQKWRLKNLDNDGYEGGQTIGQDRDMDGVDSDRTDEPQQGTTTIVEWWEILSRMGAGFRLAGVDGKNYDDKKDFVRLGVVLGHDCLIEEGEWDVPLYLDRMYPIAFEDFVEDTIDHWPQSPGGQVLSLQRGVDLLTSLRMTSCKNRDRTLILIDSELQGAAQQELQKGSSAGFIPIKLPSGKTLDTVTKVIDFGQGSVESALERDFLLKEMEVTLGTTSMVTGAQDTQAADRSATATQVRNAAAEVRTADLETRVQSLMKTSARNEALMIRLFLKEDQVTPFVKAWDINMFWVKLELPGQAALAVRPLKVAEEDEEPDENAPLTLLDVNPGAATYFDTPEGAAAAALQTWEVLQGTTDPRLVQIRDDLFALSGPMGIPPGQLPQGLSIALVDAARVWRDTAGLKPEELMREMAYKVEAGKGVKFDKQAERDYAANLMQTVLPVMLQLGDYEGANAIMAMKDDAFEVPVDKRVKLSPPPMPPEGSAPGGEEGKKPDKGESKKKTGGAK